MAQVRAFLAAAVREDDRQRLVRAIDARMSQADGKAWKEYMRELTR